MLAEADVLLRGVDAPPDAAWLAGTDAYTAVARAWLQAGDPLRAREVVAPLLAAATLTGWIPTQAAAYLEDGRAAPGWVTSPGHGRPWTAPARWGGRTACRGWWRQPTRSTPGRR